MNHIRKIKKLKKDRDLKWHELSAIVHIPPGYLHNIVNKPEIYPLSKKMKQRIEAGLLKNNRNK